MVPTRQETQATLCLPIKKALRLSQYVENKDEKGALRDYSFTVGDKLRVISYDDDNDNTPDIRTPLQTTVSQSNLSCSRGGSLNFNNPIATATPSSVGDQFVGTWFSKLHTGKLLGR